MGKYVQFDLSNLKAFFDEVKDAKGALREEMQLWLDELGNDFLDILQDRVIHEHISLSGELAASLHKGAENNVFELDGLRLEVGTNVYYADYVNSGHKQKPGRFIPGSFQQRGDGKAEFIYDPKADSGMVLKAAVVKGNLFFSNAERDFRDGIFEKTLEIKLQQWVDKSFGG